MHTIASIYQKDDSDRQEILNRARLCAALTKPWILPPSDQDKGGKLPENYQSVGSRGLTNMSGRVMMAIWPPDQSWFKFDIPAQLRYDPEVPDQFIQEIDNQLFQYEIMFQSIIESVSLSSGRGRRRTSFRSKKRMVLDQLLATGDTLEYLDDDYRLHLYRRDQYVTRRDSATDVLYHIIKQRLDPLSLTEEQLAKANLDPKELEKQDIYERMVDMFTRVQWQPLSKNWVIEQEIEDNLVNESEEPISPYFSTPFDLVSGEDYGRGFIEQNLGDLRTLNEINERLLDYAAMASKLLLFKSHSSQIRDKDLLKNSGSIVEGGDVRNGEVQDLAFFKVDKMNDFTVVFQVGDAKQKDLGKAMGIESETQPQQERVTAFQSQRFALESDGTLGGTYAPIADEQQIPLVQRGLYQMKRDRLIPPVDEDLVEVRGLTGIAAMSDELKSQRLISLAQVAASLGEQGMAKIRTDVLIDVLARYGRVTERGLVKSNEELLEEQQQQIALQTQAAAAQKGVDVAGNVAEQQLAPPAPPRQG